LAYLPFAAGALYIACDSAVARSCGCTCAMALSVPAAYLLQLTVLTR